MNRPEHDPFEDECTCFGCHIRTVQWSPSATPSRKNSIPPRQVNNSWEKGVPTDHRGMPYLDKSLNPVGIKKFIDNRSTIESKVRELHNAPAVPSTSTP